MKIEDIVQRLDELILRSNELLRSAYDVEGAERRVDEGMFHGFRSAGLSFLKNVYGEGHPYFREFDEQVRNELIGYTKQGQQILLAAKNEIESGWLASFKGIVSAEIFADFLEMASYLLSEGYKDAAAVIIGGVLEGHLRRLSSKSGIPTTYIKDGKELAKKADSLNSELSRTGVYSILDQKTITANLDLRNKAAHGQYDQYTKAQVDLMYQSVSDFVVRVAV